METVESVLQDVQSKLDLPTVEAGEGCEGAGGFGRGTFTNRTQRSQTLNISEYCLEICDTVFTRRQLGKPTLLLGYG